MNWTVPYLDLPQQYDNLHDEFDAAFRRVMQEGSFILRDDVEKFEKHMAGYLGVKHVVGVNSGTDALYLSVRAAGIGDNDEVITVAHTFVATLAAIVHAGARPVMVDICDDFNMNVDLVEAAITEKTKAIIPVHLNGRLCHMDRLEEIAQRHNLLIIEDAAQAMGAMYKGRRAGSFGIANCFSVHPMKTLSCAGDGGFVSTDDDAMAATLRLLRDHGQQTKADIVRFGYSSRLDNLQAAFLNVKFQHLDNYIKRRREIANIYSEQLSGLPLVLPPAPALEGDFFDTYNSYVVRSDKQQPLFVHLRNNGIEVFIHIPKPLYMHRKLSLPECHLPLNEKICREIISLPIFPEMADQQVVYVADRIKQFFGAKV